MFLQIIGESTKLDVIQTGDFMKPKSTMNQGNVQPKWNLKCQRSTSLTAIAIPISEELVETTNDVFGDFEPIFIIEEYSIFPYSMFNRYDIVEPLVFDQRNNVSPAEGAFNLFCEGARTIY